MAVTLAIVDRIEALCEGRTGRRPGGAIGVMRDGDCIYTSVFGSADLERDLAVTPRSLFHLGSVSKHVTGLAIAMLAERGAIGLDDDVRRYVPELPDYGVTIGIRQLLHHTSGVRDVWSVMDLMGWPEPWPCDPRALVDILARQPRLNFDPGTDFCYSNSGYILLGLIVERVTQSSLSAFCAETLFNPLGLTSMVLAPAGVASPAGSTRRYAIVDGVPRPGSDAWVPGPTGVFSTIDDIAVWDRHWSGGGAFADEVRRVCERSGTLTSGREIGYGFGWHCAERHGRRVRCHRGQGPDYDCFYYRMPEERLSVVVMANSLWMPAHSVALEIVDLIITGTAASMSTPTATAFRTSTSAAAPAMASPVAAGFDDANAKRYTEYAGSYYCADFNLRYDVDVSTGGADISLHYGATSERLTPYAADTFRGRGKIVKFDTPATSPSSPSARAPRMILQTPYVRPIPCERVIG
jgi:CubicO group peptidase (beta-lactamase class C family)